MTQLPSTKKQKTAQLPPPCSVLLVAASLEVHAAVAQWSWEPGCLSPAANAMEASGPTGSLRICRIQNNHKVDRWSYSNWVHVNISYIWIYMFKQVHQLSEMYGKTYEHLYVNTFELATKKKQPTCWPFPEHSFLTLHHTGALLDRLVLHMFLDQVAETSNSEILIQLSPLKMRVSCKKKLLMPTENVHLLTRYVKQMYKKKLVIAMSTFWIEVTRPRPLLKDRGRCGSQATVPCAIVLNCLEGKKTQPFWNFDFFDIVRSCY